MLSEIVPAPRSVALPDDRYDLFFFLNDLVDFGCAVKQQRRLQREHKQANQATEQATNRQAIEDESSKKGDEKRLSRFFTHEFFRLGYHFGKLVLGVAHAAQCNVSVFVHNFVSVARAALRVLIPLADRKSTRLNSSHVSISYAVFCLKKKKKYFAYINI